MNVARNREVAIFDGDRLVMWASVPEYRYSVTLTAFCGANVIPNTKDITRPIVRYRGRFAAFFPDGTFHRPRQENTLSGETYTRI